MKYGLLAIFFALLIAGCETATSPRAPSTSSSSAFAEPPRDRPGLGTKWGDTRRSPVEMTSFERADPAHPFAAAAIYYNDAAGIRAMAGATAWQARTPFLPDPAGALVTVELRDESGRLLPGSPLAIAGSSLVKKGGVIPLLCAIAQDSGLKLSFPWTGSMCSMARRPHFGNAAILFNHTRA
jgi:hypothetical protein